MTWLQPGRSLFEGSVRYITVVECSGCAWITVFGERSDRSVFLNEARFINLEESRLFVANLRDLIDSARSSYR